MGVDPTVRSPGKAAKKCWVRVPDATAQGRFNMSKWENFIISLFVAAAHSGAAK
jgi:hypothetical protein